MRHPVAEAKQRMATPEDVSAIRRSFMERCKALVSRNGVSRTIGKAKRVYRKKSQELGVSLNNALAQGCWFTLCRFAVPEDLEQRGELEAWPLLHLAQDAGVGWGIVSSASSSGWFYPSPMSYMWLVLLWLAPDGALPAWQSATATWPRSGGSDFLGLTGV